MGLFNKVLLAKQTWRLVLGEDSLCVKVLKGKYSRGQECMVGSSYSPRDSAFCKGVCKQTEVLKLDLARNIFNGKSTSFWFDRWLGNFALWDFKLQPIEESLARATTYDLWVYNSWN